MKTAAVIAEYNPFHNGHEYQLKLIKTELGCDYIIVIMSGEFVQRGIPAICTKNIRTKIALECGADIVIELPLLFSTGSAELFASGAIAIIDSLNCADYLAYGTEQLENTNIFSEAVSVLNNEPDDFKIILKKNLSEGLSYPAAIEKALGMTMNFSSDLPRKMFLPNNLLALQYEKQLYKLNSSVKGRNFNRIGNGFSDISLEGNYVSASALRQFIRENKDLAYNKLNKYMPQNAADILKNHLKKYAPVFEDDFSYMLFSALFSSVNNPTAGNAACNTHYLDCNDILINKIKKNIDNFYSFSQFVSRLKSKNFTYARISRALCHIMLNIKEEDCIMFKENDNCLYARILGFRETAQPLLKKIKNSSSIPIISKTANADKILNNNAMRIFKQNITASNIYHAVSRIKSNQETYNEYQYNIVKV